MNLNLYRFIQILLLPLIYVFIFYRIIIGKEEWKRIKERFGRSNAERPRGSLVWFHAASVGEANSILPLLEDINTRYENINILVTTGTVTSARLMSKRLPKNSIHQFVPIDMQFCVERFLKFWRPDVAIWVETELWPNLVCQTAATGCPMILLNSRISTGSVEKWNKHKKFAQEIFESFSMCLAQNEFEAEKFTSLGIKNVFAAGNLKYESPALPFDPEEGAEIFRKLGNRKTWLASSTNEGEEEIMVSAHLALQDKYKDLLTIIVPRHPNRAGDIKKMMEARGVNFAQRSKGDEVTAETQIYLADTIGELGIFYRLCNIVFVGGSMVPRGGQNPLEPARLKCAIVVGTNVNNFSEIYKEMQDNNAVLMVSDAAALQEQLDKLLASGNLQDVYANNAYNFVENKSGVLNKYIELLEPYFNPIAKYVA